MVGFGFFLLLHLFSRCVVVTHTKLYISLAFKTTDGDRVISFSFFPGGCVREQMGISLYMLVGGDEEWGPVLFAPFPPGPGACVCVFLVRYGRTGEQTQKTKEDGPLGSSEMKCTAFASAVWQLSCSGGGAERYICLPLCFCTAFTGELLPDI